MAFAGQHHHMDRESVASIYLHRTRKPPESRWYGIFIFCAFVGDFSPHQTSALSLYSVQVLRTYAPSRAREERDQHGLCVSAFGSRVKDRTPVPKSLVRSLTACP